MTSRKLANPVLLRQCDICSNYRASFRTVISLHLLPIQVPYSTDGGGNLKRERVSEYWVGKMKEDVVGLNSIPSPVTQ